YRALCGEGEGRQSLCVTVSLGDCRAVITGARRSWSLQAGERRQAAGCLNAQALLPIELATFQLHLALGDAERLGQKGLLMGVGLTFDGRRGKANLQTLAMQTGELVLARLGLQVAVEGQVLAIPAEPAHRQRNGLSIGGRPVEAASEPITKRSIRLMVMKAKIGEICRPPRFGSNLRKGASSGSQIWFTSCAPGL